MLQIYSFSSELPKKWVLKTKKTTIIFHNQNFMITFARMEYKATEIEGVYIIEPRVFNDARGYFFEAFKQSEFEEHIGKVNFIQDNNQGSSIRCSRGYPQELADLR